jgi:hypothetical protein
MAILGPNEMDPHAAYDGLGNYAREAEKNGTTLQAAFAGYVALEKLARRIFWRGNQ